MQALLDADLHLDGVVHVRISCQRVHQEVQLLHHVRESSNNSHSKEISGKNEQFLKNIVDSFKK